MFHQTDFKVAEAPSGPPKARVDAARKGRETPQDPQNAQLGALRDVALYLGATRNRLAHCSQHKTAPQADISVHQATTSGNYVDISLI